MKSRTVVIYALLAPLFFTGASVAATAGNEISSSTALTFCAQPAQLIAGQTATWTLVIRQKSNAQPVRDFALAHEKLLHLVVVSKDLSWFNRLHPVYKGDGVFTISAALPKAGRYKLYADYTPVGKPQEVAQCEVTVAVSATSTLPSSVPLFADKMLNVWLHRQVVAAPEGQPDAAGGATYHVEMMPVPLRAGQNVKLHFQVNDADYQPVTTLEPYLGALGHAVLISADGNIYVHSHALQSSAGVLEVGAADFNSSGPDVVFHVKFPLAGLYKVWAQVKHCGAIITAPFVLNVAASGDVAFNPQAPRAGVETKVVPPAAAKQSGFKQLTAGLILRDWQNRAVRLDDWRGQIPVFVFVDAVCPCVGAYDGRMKALEAKYRARGLRLVYVFASADEQPREGATGCRKPQISVARRAGQGTKTAATFQRALHDRGVFVRPQRRFAISRTH